MTKWNPKPHDALIYPSGERCSGCGKTILSFSNPLTVCSVCQERGVRGEPRTPLKVRSRRYDRLYSR
jgi:hypothetical protein